MITKKDFEKIAKKLQESSTKSLNAVELADIFQELNPNFNREKFFKASGWFGVLDYRETI